MVDRHRCEPARFVYDQTGNALVIAVAFSNAEDAEAFAAHFDGQEPAQIASPPEESRPAEVNAQLGVTGTARPDVCPDEL
jgi:hypothetical protein